MPAAGGSVSFDRAAGCYDATRLTDDAALGRILSLLERELAGRALEIGVGTGQLAVPLAARGVPVIGLDLSPAMLAQLRDKPGGDLPLVHGDASRLPFADASFAGAYARWVLHLIPDWERTLDELIRIVGPDGTIAIEPGGVSGIHRDVFERFREILGDVVMPPGMAPIDRDAHLDVAMRARGWACVRTEQVVYDRTHTLREYFDRLPRREMSWTWRVPDPDLGEATAQVRAWAEARTDLDEVQPELPTTWHVFRRSAA
jgi:SAM-dependent methyltransferase